MSVVPEGAAHLTTAAMASFPLVIETLLRGQDLSRNQAAAAMEAMMAPAWTPVQIAGFLVALRSKGETPEEIAGLATAMRARAEAVKVPDGAIDTCGTGGDGAGTFNVSTAAALVAAAAGAKVAKHGNRAVSSRCGSADVLEALGVKIDVPPAVTARCVAEAGFGFLFAPAHHAALRHAAAVRKDLGVRTVLNVLGPLANPAGVRRQVVGVFDPRLTSMLASALGKLGAEAALVVHGTDGLDEITTTGPTKVARLAPDGTVTNEEWSPRDFGFEPSRPDDLRGGDAAENAKMIRSVFMGSMGPRRNIVLANAAAALLVAGVAADLLDGLSRAAEALDAGRALRVLDDVKRITNEARPA